RMGQLPRRSGGASVDHQHPRQVVEKHFQQLDETAARQAPRARSLTFWYIILHLLASALTLTPLVISIFRPLGWMFGIAELILLGAALWLYSGHRRSHGQWVRNRIAAEICRSFLATWQIRRRVSYVPKVAMRDFDQLVDHLRLL